MGLLLCMVDGMPLINEPLQKLTDVTSLKLCQVYLLPSGARLLLTP